MPDNCLDKKLHNNTGSSQAQRVLLAVSAAYAKVDERSASDLLLFAKNYGAYLNYFDATNTLQGNWSDFMGKDISATIAAVQVWNTVDYMPYITTLSDCIKSPTPPYNNSPQTFKYIFDFIFSIVKSLNNALLQLPADEDYTRFLSTSITSKLSIPISQLSAYYIFFLQHNNNLIDTTSSSVDALAPFNEIISIPPDKNGFGLIFGFVNHDPWALPANVIIPLPDMFTNDTLNEIITNNFFNGAVTSFLNGITSIVNQTSFYLDKTLLNYPKHEPHYALYMSFLRLFRFAQDHLNTYTERHLEFYYKKVLRLDNNRGLADTAHLVFSLQKNVDQHLLTQGTRFKAGKDASNNDLFYSLTNDIVVNQASVQAIKSLFLIKNYAAGSKTILQKLFASPKANSADGQGAKITSGDKSWYAFGDLGNKDFVANNAAEVGFAIASNILFLNEGARTIKISFNCKQSAISLSSPLNDIFSVSFTGIKKWFDAMDYPGGTANSISINSDTDQTILTVTINLNGDAPPIVPYSQKIHGGNFIEALPMVQIKVADYSNYAIIKSLIISSVDLEVSVDAVKNLSLQNDAGKVDASRPFKPFGEFPENGASFIIGSKEIFQKNLSALSVNFTQLPVPDSVSRQKKALELAKKEYEALRKLKNTTSLNFFALEQGDWQSAGSVSFDGGSSLPGQVNNFNIPFSPSLPDFSANVLFDVTSVTGFIKIQLIDTEYNLSSYLSNVQSSLASTTVAVSGVGTADQTYTINPPAQIPLPSSPVAQTVSVSYAAKASINLIDKENFLSRTDFFYHIEPFGFREMHPGLTKDDITALPVFNLDNKKISKDDKGQPSDPDNGGELWIGLSGTKPGESHSILFEVSEGSSNPLKDVTSVSWFYMSSNNWMAFDPDSAVNDQTNNLSESGLIIFNFQGDETTNNTRGDTNLLWIKAVVKNDTDAICKLIDVQANAARAQFVTDASHEIYFTNNIGAKIISKPAIADAAIKQTNQPFPSFGGRPKETDQQFDQRVSERLRHKHRAVSTWDYERLVLQNFPQVYKVKCLNHTSFKSKTQDYSEMRPGDVMIVTVPDLSLVSGANPLLPFTNTGLLGDIKKFIKSLCSPFVHVHVCNPQFEGVQFSFDVSYKSGNINYNKQRLDMDIEQFLMPWAFGSAAADIEFDGKIEKSVVLDYVQNRPYVDFVTCFTMSQYVYREDGTFKLLFLNLEEAIATTARSILVPYKDPVTGLGNIISSPANCKCNG